MENKEIQDAIKAAAREAVKTYDNEKKQQQKKKVFHNTRLLMEHYNELKDHIEKAISDIEQLKKERWVPSEIDIRCSDETYIESIKISKTRTLIMVSHIDVAMRSLKENQKLLGTPEKYKALEKFYKDRQTYEKIAEDLNCSTATARRWINEMIRELSVNLFGIDGLKMDLG